MSTVAVTAPNEVSSPRRTARIAGAVYLLVFLTGGAALVVRGPLGAAAGLTAGVCYVVVTLLLMRAASVAASAASARARLRSDSVT